MVEGTPSWAGSPADGLSLGGAGPAPATPPQVGTQPGVFEPPNNYDPKGGNGRPNGGIPPDYLLDSKGTGYGGLPYKGSTLGLGTGVTGIAKDPAIDWSSVITPPKHGYESSSNKDFYQRQFQQQEGQQNGQRFQELAAAIRARQAAAAPPAAPKDPWGWANLPEVKMGGTVAATPIEWGLNKNYGITPGMTNQQATGAVSSVLTPEEAAMMAQHWKENPTGATGTNWVNSGSPNTLVGQLGGGISPEFTSTLQKVFNNIYTQTGGGTGGVSVPTGYAHPTNGLG
jgi:hypothetical protein